MVLDVAELLDLATFLAKRFPDVQTRRGIAARAGVGGGGGDEPVAAWEAVLHAAQSTGSFGSLAKALSSAAPEDKNLQEACAILRPPLADRSMGRLRFAVVGAALVVVLVGLGILNAGSAGDPPGAKAPGVMVAASPTAQGSAAVSSGAEGSGAEGSGAAAAPLGAPLGGSAEANPTGAPPSSPAPVLGAAALPAGASPTGASPAAASPAAASPAAASAAVSPPAATPPEGDASSTARTGDSRARSPTGCGGSDGVVAGWWYAGASSPGAVGATFTLDHDARVRADYPRAQNHNDPHAPERCVLPSGGRYVLSHAPIEASKGHWWVPYAPGDAAG